MNGAAASNPSFYAPTTAGSSGQVLISNGSGEPSWGIGDWLPKSGGTLLGDVIRRVT